MKRYSSAQARARLASLLDAAETGEPVVIERRGVRFVVRAEPPATRRAARGGSPILRVDPAVVDGSYTWVPGDGGLQFARRKGAAASKRKR